MGKRLVQAAAAVLLMIGLTVSAFVLSIFYPAPGSRREVPAQETSSPGETEEKTESVPLSEFLASKGTVSVTILGDSIAKGYFPYENVNLEPYGNLVMEQLASEGEFEYEIVNYAKNGLDSFKMNNKILLDEEVCESLKKSDVIFITVGSNDLLNTCKNAVREILDTDTKFKSVEEALDVLSGAVSENPFLVLKIIEAVQEWDYRSFEDQWIEMMETIEGMKKEDAKIIVTNIYNPASHLELPFTMNRGVDGVIQNMNQIIAAYADEYGYLVADVFHSDVYEHVQKDGLHPDQEGQQIIADTILEEL